MRIRSFKILSLAAFIKVNSANAVCAPGNGVPVVAISQPGNVENCATTSQPLILDNNSFSNNGSNAFSPECLVVPTQNMPVQGVPVQTLPGQVGQNNMTPPSSGNMTECVPVSTPQNNQPQYNPPMATTIINPPSYAPPGTPGGPSANNPPAGSTPPGNQTPPPANPDEKCTVTVKLENEPITSGGVEAIPAPAGPPVEQVGVPPIKIPAISAIPAIPVVSAVPPVQKVVVPPVQMLPPPSVPCVSVGSGVGHPNNSANTNHPGSVQVPCIPTQNVPVQQVPVQQVPVQQVPVQQVPVTALPGTVSSLPPTTSLGSGSGVPLLSSGGSPTALCTSSKNALNSICSSGNAISSQNHSSSNVGAACSLPNAENCLQKALENIGKPTLQEAASCITSVKQPMVEIGMMLPASEKYSQAMNNPCVMN